MAKQDQVSTNQPPEPEEGIPPAFKVGAVLFFVLLLVIALVLTPGVRIPN
jgi:hypothetical protein